jgi:hypothetical protein
MAFETTRLIDRDAGTFLRIVTAFLLRHPSLLDNRVVLIGETFGGTRATLMLSYLFNYLSVREDSGAGYRDGQLSTALAEYFLAVFGTEEPTSSQISSRFGLGYGARGAA